MTMFSIRGLRRSLAFRIGSIFIVVLVATTAAAVVAIRQFIRRDLQEGTRR